MDQFQGLLLGEKRTNKSWHPANAHLRQFLISGCHPLGRGKVEIICTTTPVTQTLPLSVLSVHFGIFVNLFHSFGLFLGQD